MDLAKLEEFERAVYCRRHGNRLEEVNAAMAAMLQCLWPLREGSHFEGHDLSNVTADYTRMAAAIMAMLVDPWFRPTVEGFQHLAANRNIIETIFKASVFGNADYAFQLLSDDSKFVNKYLVFMMMGSKIGLDLEEVFRGDPEGTFGLYLAMLGHPHILTPEADAKRERLLELYPIFEDVTLGPALHNAMCGAYMHLSYAHGEKKHAPKRLFHKMLAKNLVGHVQQLEAGPRVRKERPTILLMFEWWHTSHAMYRSYAKSIIQLKRDFKIIGCCPGTNTDAPSREIFDEWIDFDGEQMVLADIANQILKIAPDMIYYPSIGMSVAAISMASLRLAPIQVMSYGHPATSNSPVIDYGLIEADCYDARAFGEQVVTLPPNVVRPTPAQVITARHQPRRSDVIRIGVSAMQVKVTWPFIRAIQAVQDRAHKKIEVWFFSAVYGVGLYAFANELEKMVANLMVQERQHYADYMATLASCDICLFSFPFGGANSMYDALELGIPVVSLEGIEPHSKSDASIIRRAGLPEWLITHSEEEYVDTILKLQDDDIRIMVANRMASVDIQQKFFSEDNSGAFADAFRRIYLNNTVEQHQREAA